MSEGDAVGGACFSFSDFYPGLKPLVITHISSWLISAFPIGARSDRHEVTKGERPLLSLHDSINSNREIPGLKARNVIAWVGVSRTSGGPGLRSRKSAAACKDATIGRHF